MTKDPQPNPPQVQVELETPWGRATQQVNVQSNRPSPRDRFAYSWLAILFPPPNLADMALDAACYVLVAALAASVGKQVLWVLMLPPVAFLLLAGCCGVAVLAYMIGQEVNRGWLLLTYRGLLLAIGLIVGGVL